MTAWTCVLCAAGGQETLAPRFQRTVICQDHQESLAATGRGWCGRGRHVAPRTELRSGTCRTCDNARRNARYWANAAQEQAAARERYARDPQAAARRVRAWERANPDRTRAYHAAYKRRWRARKPDAHRAIVARYRATHREHLKAVGRAYRLRLKLRVLRQIRRAA